MSQCQHLICYLCCIGIKYGFKRFENNCILSYILPSSPAFWCWGCTAAYWSDPALFRVNEWTRWLCCRIIRCVSQKCLIQCKKMSPSVYLRKSGDVEAKGKNRKRKMNRAFSAFLQNSSWFYWFQNIRNSYPKRSYHFQMTGQHGLYFEAQGINLMPACP